MILDITKNQKLILLVPQVVIKELDRFKDNKTHKENRNAHKIIQNINDSKLKTIQTSIEGGNNDDYIIQCAKEQQKNYDEVFIISEDKTFKLKYKNTLKINEFIEKFKTYQENIPDKITQEFFQLLYQKNFKEAYKILPKIKINAYNSEGFTPLILAISANKIPIIKDIINLKADIHKFDMSHLKMAPLAHAIQKDNIELINFLIENGAKPYICSKGKNKGNTPFLMACWDNRKNAIEILEILIKHGISINQIDGNGYTGLIKASIKGHVKIVKWLLEHRADTKIRDFNSKSALDHAIENNHKEIEKLLKEHDA
ncbi:hypothetical protein BKN38_02605 [Helicobacter sp. CLO-3]|nr:hypothetical protein BA723_00430 [Helicobacter sp. CLO-3]OHU84710.1 hypothetical protein BKN38_02605 [Helicobacter sp. CLO-3]